MPATGDLYGYQKKELIGEFKNAGRDHDTPAVAVASIRRWWNTMEKHTYAGAEELFITADAGGSKGYRSHAWKHELQKLQAMVMLGQPTVNERLLRYQHHCPYHDA